MSKNAQWLGGKPSVLIFDVNETLIDFESMNPLLEGCSAISTCCASGLAT
jgi:hypothetical protein